MSPLPAVQRNISTYTRVFLLVLVLAMTTVAAQASVIFDWPDTPGWTAGAPLAGQTVSQSFTSVSPNDITVAINNSGAASQGINNQAGYPAINSTNETGGFSGVNALQLYASSSAVVGAYLKTTVSFTSPVTNLSFQLWDVDASAGQFIDTIKNLQALSQDGITIVAPSSVTSEVAGYNTITGSGLGMVITGVKSANNSTNEGTIDVVFNMPITQFSFEWSNGDAGLGGQAIGLGPLTYDIVPECDSTLGVMAACLTAVLFETRRRRRAQA